MRPADSVMKTNEPCVVELTPAPHPLAAFQRLAGQPHCLFLDSSRRDGKLGRYSFLAADPFDYLEAPVAGPERLTELADKLAQYPVATISSLPPFQGGAAGLASYDMG